QFNNHFEVNKITGAIVKTAKATAIKVAGRSLSYKHVTLMRTKRACSSKRSTQDDTTGGDALLNFANRDLSIEVSVLYQEDVAESLGQFYYTNLDQYVDGADVCTECGTSDMNNFTYYVSYNHNKDDYLKKKSCHNRVRWFERHLFKHVAPRDRDTIREQFRSIVRCIQRLRLQRGRNIVRYKFYLLRIASMNGITLKNPPEDIKTQRIVNILEDRLYGKVFVDLGWKPEKCKYYDNWKVKNKIIK
ncbi:Hypothetical predicted protein, partial [Paramuricea clavata]